MSELPTYYDYVRRFENQTFADNRPYNVILAEAFWGGQVKEYSNIARVAGFARNYVQAQSRLNLLLQRNSPVSQNEIIAQQADLPIWQKRASELGFSSSFDQLVSFMTQAASNSQEMDFEEKTHMTLGLQGRIGEIEVLPELHTYSYDAY